MTPGRWLVACVPELGLSYGSGPGRVDCVTLPRRALGRLHGEALIAPAHRRLVLDLGLDLRGPPRQEWWDNIAACCDLGIGERLTEPSGLCLWQGWRRLTDGTHRGHCGTVWPELDDGRWRWRLLEANGAHDGRQGGVQSHLVDWDHILAAYPVGVRVCRLRAPIRS